MEKKCHVAVIPFPFASHPAATLNFMRRLAAAAPNATFSFFNTARSNRSLFGSQTDYDDCFVNIKVYNVDDGTPEDWVFAGGAPGELMVMFEKVTPQNYMKAIEKAVSDTGKNITCLLTGPYIWQAADMSEELKVPWVLFWTAGACYLSTLTYTDLIRNTVATLDNSGRENTSLDFIPGHSSALYVKDLPKETLVDDLEHVFTRMLYQMIQTIPRWTTVAFNEFEELNPSIIDDFRSKPVKWLAVGPLNLITSPSPSNPLDPYGCIPWLDSQKPSSVAYVSFGTMSPLPPNELIALAEALDKIVMPFIWTLKDDMKMLLPQEFLHRASKRGMVIPWAPQSQILEHTSVGVFVTHCGWKSVLESITGGVPLICRPFFGDQLLNALLVSKVWGVGVRAEDGVFTKDGLIDAFNLIMLREDGKIMKEKVGTLKQLAVKAVGAKGSSTRNFDTLLQIVTTTNLVFEIHGMLMLRELCPSHETISPFQRIGGYHGHDGIMVFEHEYIPPTNG